MIVASEDARFGHPGVRGLDAAGQFTQQSYSWGDKVRESMESGSGLRDALDWRDGPYRDYRKA